MIVLSLIFNFFVYLIINIRDDIFLDQEVPLLVEGENGDNFLITPYSIVRSGDKLPLSFLPYADSRN